MYTDPSGYQSIDYFAELSSNDYGYGGGGVDYGWGYSPMQTTGSTFGFFNSWAGFSSVVSQLMNSTHGGNWSAGAGITFFRNEAEARWAGYGYRNYHQPNSKNTTFYRSGPIRMSSLLGKVFSWLGLGYFTNNRTDPYKGVFRFVFSRSNFAGISYGGGDDQSTGVPVEVYIWEKGGGLDVGHTAIRIGGLVYGYYPTDVNGDGEYTKKDLKNSPGVMHINSIWEFKNIYSGDKINAFVLNITTNQRIALMESLSDFTTDPGYYSLYGNNCTSVVYSSLLNAGVRLPNMSLYFSSWTLGLSPSGFGALLNNSSVVSNTFSFTLP
jgi:hypothetical protein